MDADKIKQLAGNLRHAGWTGKGATIGGGKFSADECKAAAAALYAAPAMLAALQEIAARGRLNDPRTQYGGFDADSAGDAVALAEWEAAEIARAAITAATGASKRPRTIEEIADRNGGLQVPTDETGER